MAKTKMTPIAINAMRSACRRIASVIERFPFASWMSELPAIRRAHGTRSGRLFIAGGSGHGCGRRVREHSRSCAGRRVASALVLSMIVAAADEAASHNAEAGL